MLRVLLLLLVAFPLSARTLQWRALEVDARLDRDGNLRVVERHVMVFDGDWNGGKRDFNVALRHTLDVNRVARVDGGREIAMDEGNVEQVDHWERSGNSIKWRSRLPEDPPFANQELTYLLDVTYRNVLQPQDDPKQFVLEHDFGMPAREGAIENYTLELTFDPIWGDVPPVLITRANVQPGASEMVTRRLTYGGAADPAGVRRPVAAWIPIAALAAFAFGVCMLIARFVVQERETGRFAPVEPRFDASLLELPPEVAGAMWDAGVGAPEVAAVLARMTWEGKLKSRVDDDTLHLTLKVSRDNLTGYERALVTKLFFDGRDTTDTDAIRAHYSRTGFDPASHIRIGIEEKLTRLVDWDQKVKRFRGLIDALAIVGAGLLALAVGLFTEGAGVGAAILVIALSAFVTIFACLAAHHFSKRVDGMESGFAVVGVLCFVLSAPFLVTCVWARVLDVQAPVLFALALWTLTLLNLIFDWLKIQHPPELIAYRKRVAAARRYFIRELRKPEPDMRDEWYPYVLAFGLGNHVGRWFKAFGGATPGSSTSSSSSWSSASTGGRGWTGGGGAFGGAGASGTWAVAAGGLAAGVAAPSSSGSGSSGGSSSSSGGGGGGGW